MKVIAITLLILIATGLAQNRKNGDANGLGREILKITVRKLTSGVTKDNVRAFDTAKCAECVSKKGPTFDKDCPDVCSNVIKRTKNEYLSSKNRLYDSYRTKDCLNCAVRNSEELLPANVDVITPSKLDHHCEAQCCYYNCGRKCRIKDMDRILAKLISKEGDEYLKTEFDFTGGANEDKKIYRLHRS